MKLDMRMAKMNWRNFFRMAVGLPKTYEVKIVRNELAKQYPMIKVKKAGDVGYDLCCTEDCVVPANSDKQLQAYKAWMEFAKIEEEKGNEEQAKIYREHALSHVARVVVPTGIKLEMPNNVWCTLEARSSTSKKMLVVPTGIIDAGYRGELFGVLINVGQEDVHVKAGDRFIQVIFHETVLADFKEVDELSKSESGETGFGSTGK